MISYIHRHIVGNMKDGIIYLNEEETETVRLTVFEPIPDKADGGRFIGFQDDSEANVCFSADQIDDIIEALQDLKAEL